MGGVCLQSRCSRRLVRCVSTALMLCLVASVLGSAVVAVFKWRRISSSPTPVSSSPAADLSCSPCSCHCPVMPQKLPHRSGCRETDPNTEKQLQDRAALLMEEIYLCKTVARESLERTEGAIRTQKRTSVRFQNEASKCRACVETCEKGRERAEAELVKERRLTKLWEKRARERGWRDDTIPGHR